MKIAHDFIIFCYFSVTEGSNIEKLQEVTVFIKSIKNISELLSNNQKSKYLISFPNHSCIFIDKDLAVNLELENGSKVTLQKLIDADPVICTKIEVTPKGPSVMKTDSFRDHLKRVASNGNKVLLNNNFVTTIDNDSSCLLKLYPININYCSLSIEDIEKIEVQVNDPQENEDPSRDEGSKIKDNLLNNVVKK